MVLRRVVLFVLFLLGVAVLPLGADAQSPTPAQFTLTKSAPTGDATTAFPIQLFGDAGLVAEGALSDQQSLTVTTSVGAAIDIFESQTVLGWVLDDLVCTGARIDIFDELGGAATIVVTDPVAACTIVNTRIPVVTVTKAVESGLPGDADFEFSDPIEGQFFFVEAGESFSVAVAPNTGLQLEEFMLPGWVLTDFSCDGAVASNFSSDPFVSSMVVAVGTSDVSCTATNGQPQVEVTITKSAPESDGTDQFFVSATDLATAAGASDFLADGDSIVIDAVAGSEVAIEESNPPGWVLDELSCDGGAVVSFAGDAAFVQVGDGPSVSCTIVNSRTFVPVTITKEAPGASPFELFGFRDQDGNVFNVADGESFTAQAAVNQRFEIEEFVEFGWLFDDIDCGSASVSTSLFGQVLFSIDVRTEPVICTVTNQREPQFELTVVKVVDGPDRAFTFDVVPGDGPVTTGDLANGESFVAEFPVDQDFVDVFEATGADWYLAEVDCDGAFPFEPAQIDDNLVGNVTMLIGGRREATCTFVNRRVPTLQFSGVANGPGAETVTFDFESGGGTFSGQSGMVFDTQFFGSTSVSVEVPAGWTVTGVTCDPAAAIDDQVVAAPAPSGGSATVDVRQVGGDVLVDCVFVAEPFVVPTASVTVAKTVDGFDTGREFDFQIGGQAVALAAGEEVSVVVPTDASLDLRELIPLGWELIAVDCGDADVVVLDDGVTLSLEPDAVVRCEFINRLGVQPPDPVLELAGVSGPLETTVGQTFEVRFLACTGGSATWQLLGPDLAVVAEGLLTEVAPGDYQGIASFASVGEFDLRVDVVCGAIAQTASAEVRLVAAPTPTPSPIPTPTATPTPTAGSAEAEALINQLSPIVTNSPDPASGTDAVGPSVLPAAAGGDASESRVALAITGAQSRQLFAVGLLFFGAGLMLTGSGRLSRHVRRR